MSNSTAGFPSLPPDQPLLDLRARAEQRLRLEARPAEELTPHESQWLVQELRVHQVELEALNKEVLDAQVEHFCPCLKVKRPFGGRSSSHRNCAKAVT